MKLVNKLVDVKVAPSNTDEDFSVFIFDVDALGAKSVYARAFSKEHDLQFTTIGVIINVIGDFYVNRVGFDRQVDLYL